MTMLPRGYYAVQSDFETADKTKFTYKGVTYEVEAGVNLFPTVFEAEKVANDIPEVVLAGITYERFEAPVILFSTGRHKIDKYTPRSSRYILGEGACVNPNLPVSSPTQVPAFNPTRADESAETVLFGGFYEGYVLLNSPAVELFVEDGFVLDDARSFDERPSGEGDCLVIFRNNIYKSPSGDTYHYHRPPKADSKLYREFRLENSRMQDFNDIGHGGSLIYPRIERIVIDGLCCDNSTMMVGFNGFIRQRGSTFAPHVKDTEITIKNSCFHNTTGMNGISTGCHDIGDHTLSLTVTNCTFLDASRKGEPVLTPHLANENCTLTLRGCTFVDTRGNATAISVYGKGDAIEIENTTLTGFDTAWSYMTSLPTEAPDYVENKDTDWQTDTEDAHTVLAMGSADFSAMDARYEGKRAYYGDQHTHTKCGGTSDGAFPMEKWVERMDELQLDFAIIVDHRQMRGFFLPEWDTDRFVYGTEPGGSITDAKSVHFGNYGSFHYNMLFPHEYGLAMLLANFPEYGFKGDELTGYFNYPRFTRARFDELVAYLHKIGGMMVHPHPRSLLGADDPLDYYFGEHTYLETLYDNPGAAVSFTNYELWCDILALGKHVYASGGSDTHGDPSNKVVTTFYCPERTGRACFDCMKLGDYTVGSFGMKMCIDGNPMGSENVYRDGMTLTLRVDDRFAPHATPNTVYELRIYSDKGLVYSSLFNGEQPQQLALKVQKRKFYRAEIFDLTHGYRAAIGNPVWLDKDEE